MDTQQRPANRITVEQAKAIVEALNPGLSEEDEENDLGYEYQEWDEDEDE